MLLFFTAVAPDVMNKSGTNWEKPDWIAGTENDWVTVGHPEASVSGKVEQEHAGREHN